MAGNKEKWKDFYNAEKALFNFLNDACVCLHSIGVNNAEILKYRQYETASGCLLERPPRFIHWIGKLKSPVDESIYIEKANLVFDNYRRAVGKTFSRYPVRFPEFYTNIDQINISSSSAYSSKGLNNDEVLRLKTIEYKNKGQLNDAIKLINDDIKILNNEGYTEAFMIKVADLRSDALALEIPAQSITKRLGGRKVQVRKFTGLQYRALIREAGSFKGIRKKLGLMVLSNNSLANIYFSVPQALRKHSYDSSGEIVDLKITTDVTLWVK